MKKLARTDSELRRQAGQLLIMGFEGTELSAGLSATLRALQPAGIVLFARNIVTPQQTWKLLRECRRCLQVPPFLCVDMEGGTVDRLREVIAPAPSAAEVAASGNARLYRKHGELIGNECRTLGFNTDFAPVVDLGLGASRKVLGSRTASGDPKAATAYARGFLRGLKDAGVLGCLKHFPGLGAANLDTHLKLPLLDRSWKQFWEADLYPYRQLHRAAAFVMIAHAAYPGLTKEKTPATLSKKLVTDVLRKKVGFRRLAISDDMEMGALAAAAPIEGAAVETLRAGTDILLVCRKAEMVCASYEAVLHEAERDRRFARLVAEKARRVLVFKQKSKELARQTPSPRQPTIDRLRREIWELGEEVRMTALARE